MNELITMSAEEQRNIFEYQMNLAKEQGIKEKGSEPHTQYHTYTIKDKITPQIRKKFLQAIKSTKEIGVEHGFHLCIEKDGKLSPGEMCVGDECSIKLHEIHMPCGEKKNQGDFHTHPYLEDARKYFNITFKASDKLMKSAIRQFLEEKGRTVTMPSHSDARDAILGKCAKKTEGTTCIGTDLDDSKVECWTPKDIGEDVCIMALAERLGASIGEDNDSTLPHEWIRPFFDAETIDLKSVKRRNSDKR
jgi:hypothetical protein